MKSARSFICGGCGWRVAVLYCGEMFTCRHCYLLVYSSQREPSYDRAARKAARIREKLGWKPGLFSGSGWKPKGMHWTTFGSLITQYEAFMKILLAGMGSRLNLLRESMDD